MSYPAFPRQWVYGDAYEDKRSTRAPKHAQYDYDHPSRMTAPSGGAGYPHPHARHRDYQSSEPYDDRRRYYDHRDGFRDTVYGFESGTGTAQHAAGYSYYDAYSYPEPYYYNYPASYYPPAGYRAFPPAYPEAGYTNHRDFSYRPSEPKPGNGSSSSGCGISGNGGGGGHSKGHGGGGGYSSTFSPSIGGKRQYSFGAKKAAKTASSSASKPSVSTSSSQSDVKSVAAIPLPEEKPTIKDPAVQQLVALKLSLLDNRIALALAQMRLDPELCVPTTKAPPSVVAIATVAPSSSSTTTTATKATTSKEASPGDAVSRRGGSSSKELDMTIPLRKSASLSAKDIPTLLPDTPTLKRSVSSASDISPAHKKPRGLISVQVAESTVANSSSVGAFYVPKTPAPGPGPGPNSNPSPSLSPGPSSSTGPNTAPSMGSSTGPSSTLGAGLGPGPGLSLSAAGAANSATRRRSEGSAGRPPLARARSDGGIDDWKRMEASPMMTAPCAFGGAGAQKAAPEGKGERRRGSGGRGQRGRDAERVARDVASAARAPTVGYDSREQLDPYGPPAGYEGLASREQGYWAGGAAYSIPPYPSDGYDRAMGGGRGYEYTDYPYEYRDGYYPAQPFPTDGAQREAAIYGRDPRNPREPRDLREQRDPRDPRGPRDVRDARPEDHWRSAYSRR